MDMTRPVGEERFTALWETHGELGATFTDFGGWQMPLKYGSEILEHHAVRRSAGLFDLSHMGEIFVTGADAGVFLDFALVGNMSPLSIGKAKYSLICDQAGGILDDLICYRLEAHRYLVVPNAGNALLVASEFKRRATGFDVSVVDASAETSLIAVQGPNAEAVLLRLLSPEDAERIRALKYYASTTVAAEDRRLLVARTGYTGEDGFELFVPNEAARRLWGALLSAGSEYGLIPCGLAARDSLRLEAGMPLYGNELSRQRTPYSAGLGAVVSFSKEGDFVGRHSLEEFKALGVGTVIGRTLVGLRGDGRRAGRNGHVVLKDGAQIGEVTSGQPSPTLGHQIALAFVDIPFAKPGTDVDIDVRGTLERFVVVPLPFYVRGTK